MNAISTRTNTSRLTTLEWQRFERIGAWLTLLGVLITFFGLSWDLQWHRDVGPDTFWTLPHLFVYAGAALTGAACLTTVLLCTQLAGSARRADWIPVLGGRFHAPVGFVIAGFGAFGFLTFGFFDQWWHTVFGFDAVVSSPPHVGLILSDVMSLVGCALIFGSTQKPRVPETVVAVALALGFSLPWILTTMSELGWIIPLLALPALLLPLGMGFAASVTRQVWAALWVMLVFSGFRWLFWWLFPILTKA